MRKMYLVMALGLVFPLGTHAASLTLQERVELRRQQRMQQRTQTISPRRISRYSTGEVVRIIDGSVFHIRMPNGDIDTIRTLGSEAPLLQRGSVKQKEYADNAKKMLQTMLLGHTVSLEKDAKYRKDQQGRLLRYVKLRTLDVNGWMIWNGYTFADTDNDYSKQRDYVEREYDAKKNDRGMWGNRIDIEILQ